MGAACRGTVTNASERRGAIGAQERWQLALVVAALALFLLWRHRTNFAGLFEALMCHIERVLVKREKE